MQYTWAGVALLNITTELDAKNHLFHRKLDMLFYLLCYSGFGCKNINLT